MRYLLGILAGILSGLAFTAASIAQKRAMNGIKAEAPLFRNLIASPLWLAGFAAAFVLGAPLNMAAYAALGPTLPPALSSIGLAAVPVLARIFLAERPGALSYAGAAAMTIAIILISQSGIAIAPENVDWVDPSFLARAAASVGCIAAVTAACLLFGMRSRSGGGVGFALAAGAAQALMNTFMTPIAGQLGLLVSGSLGVAGLFIAGAAGLALAAVNFGAIAVAQLALRKGNAAVIIPIQQLPIQVLPLVLHVALYRGSFGGTAQTVSLAAGLVLLIAGSFALGSGRKPSRKKTSAAPALLVLLFALAHPLSLNSQEPGRGGTLLRYACLDDAGRQTATIEMRVTSSGHGMEIESTDSSGIRGFARLGPDMVQEEVRFGTASGGMLRFALENSGDFWKVEGGSASFLSRAGNAVLGDRSLFFILPTLIDPKRKGQEARFVLVRPEGGQRAVMRLRAEGIVDTADMGGKMKNAYRISMELADPIGRLFWPYSYNYFYRVGDLRFFAYGGPDENKKKTRIVLMEAEE